MKRISIFLVLVIFITACMPLSITGSSASDTISKAEAQELVSKAYRFSCNVRGVIHTDKAPIPDYNNPISVYVDSIGEEVSYHRVIEENLPGGSFEAMKEYAKTIYINNVAPYAYQYSAGYGSLKTQSNLLKFTNSSFYTESKHRPLFHTDAEGVLYSSVQDYQVGFSFALLNDDDNEQAIYDFNLIDNVALKIISGDSDSATALVSFIWCKMDDTPPFNIQTVECKFVKTNDGWRIDESEFSILCATSDKNTLAAYRASESPSTSDPSFNLVFILPTVSVAAIASAVCLMRRRRDLI